MEHFFFTNCIPHAPATTTSSTTTNWIDEQQQCDARFHLKPAVATGIPVLVHVVSRQEAQQYIAQHSKPPTQYHCDPTPSDDSVVRDEQVICSMPAAATGSHYTSIKHLTSYLRARASTTTTSNTARTVHSSSNSPIDMVFPLIASAFACDQTTASASANSMAAHRKRAQIVQHLQRLGASDLVCAESTHCVAIVDSM
jgi:hypothetical protein